MKYLGKGTPNNLQPKLTDHARLVRFAVQQALSATGKASKAYRLGSDKVPMWKMKRLLIESLQRSCDSGQSLCRGYGSCVSGA